MKNTKNNNRTSHEYGAEEYIHLSGDWTGSIAARMYSHSDQSFRQMQKPPLGLIPVSRLEPGRHYGDETWVEIQPPCAQISSWVAFLEPCDFYYLSESVEPQKPFPTGHINNKK